MKTRIVLLAGAAAAIAAAGPASALVVPSLSLTPQKAAGGNGSQSGIHDKTTTDTRDCGDSRTITYVGPTSIWPPNHKMRDFSITAHDADSEGGMVTLVTTVISDQPANGTGDGNTATDIDAPPVDADAAPETATTAGQVRGERSGNDKTGRTYTFTSTATWEDTTTCTQEFVATVPHDQRDQANTGSGKKSKKASRRRAALRH